VSLQASLALPSRASSGVLQFGVYGWTFALEPVEADRADSVHRAQC
jgi:hypothetical protein